MSCAYCGQTGTKLQNGYCVRYSCESRLEHDKLSRAKHKFDSLAHTTSSTYYEERKVYEFGKLKEKRIIKLVNATGSRLADGTIMLRPEK